MLANATASKAGIRPNRMLMFNTFKFRLRRVHQQIVNVVFWGF